MSLFSIFSSTIYVELRTPKRYDDLVYLTPDTTPECAHEENFPIKWSKYCHASNDMITTERQWGFRLHTDRCAIKFLLFHLTASSYSIHCFPLSWSLFDRPHMSTGHEVVQVKRGDSWILAIGMRADIAVCRKNLYKLQCSRNDLEGPKEILGDVVTYPCCISASFWCTMDEHSP